MIHLFYHTGSANHGCEAIVRSTVKMLGLPVTLWSFSPNEDVQYEIDKIADIREDTYVSSKKNLLKYGIGALEHKLTGSDYRLIRAGHAAFLNEVNRGDVCMSIGGDNYCYQGVEKLGYYNRMLKAKGAITILWGCSVEPSVLSPAVIKDLRRYDLITVRESLSYDGLIHAGVKDNVVLCTDPAFQLEMRETQMPKGFASSSTIGINISPLVTQMAPIVLKNYIELIHFILEETDDNILLIPHVVKEGSNDTKLLSQIAESINDVNRIAVIPDCNCMQLKSLISKCRLFIGARTHATIAAYSTNVPTLVCGYSVKARGIARDLFGTDQNYVVPIQNMKTENDLKEKFIWLLEHTDQIKRHLIETIPAYREKAYIAKDALDNLIKER